jgi:sulfite exporter TauE/SafE
MDVSGGLLLSSAAIFRRAYGNGSAADRMKPVFLFTAGRIVSYGLLGGTIGALGSALIPSPLATGIITIVAAVFMLIIGLDMLGLAPRWLLGLLPRMPKVLGHRIMDASGGSGWLMPFVLGAATFFVPCGFTQSFQIYALSSGSFADGAAALAGFAIGTSPALLAIGLASNALKGTAGRFFFQVSGAIVVVLGIWNVQNGLTVAGYPLTPRSLTAGMTASDGLAADDRNVAFDGKIQTIRMKLGADPFYLPSDEYTVRAGYPVRMEIEGIGTGCRTIFQIPKFGVSVALSQPLNVVEFTPDKAGDATFSCSMGMFRGTLHVVAGS